MSITKKFQTNIHCICDECVVFDIIYDVECDWGIHTLVQCPKCEEVFSTDKRGPAFQNILKLLINNPSLYSNKEETDYQINSHPC